MINNGKIKTIIEGKELPFITVPDGIAYGKAMAEIAREDVVQAQERAETLAQATQVGQFNQASERFIDPEKLDALNFNVLLDAEQNHKDESKNESPQQSELDGQKQEHTGKDNRHFEDNPELSGKQLEDLEERIDAKSQQMKTKAPISRENTKEEKEKKVKEEMTSKTTRETTQTLGVNQRDEQANIRKEDRADEKELREQSLGELKRNEMEKLEGMEAKQKATKTLEVTARFQERVHLDDFTGKETYKQTEIAQQKSTKGVKENSALGDLLGNGKNGKSASVMGKVQEAKVNAKADNFMQSMATVTHVTGRTTEFNVGKDVLQFRREGEETNAYKNGQQIGPKETREMIKDLAKQVGEAGMRRMEVLSKNPMVQQRSMQELTQGDTSGVQKQKDTQTKSKEKSL